MTLLSETLARILEENYPQNPYTKEVFACQTVADFMDLAYRTGQNYHIEYPPRKKNGTWDESTQTLLRYPVAGVLCCCVDEKGKPYICSYYETIERFDNRS